MFKTRITTPVVPVSPQDNLKQALLSIVQVWLDRLQQQAVVTTFLISIDGLLFSLTSNTRSKPLNEWSKRDQLVNASLGGAIIFHVFAAIIAYVASFVLIRYRLSEAQQLRERANHPSLLSPPSPTRASISDKRHLLSSRIHRTSMSMRSTAATEPKTDENEVDALPSEEAAPEASGPRSPSIAEESAEAVADLHGLVHVCRTHPIQQFMCFGLHRPSRARRDSEVASLSMRDEAVAMLQTIMNVLSRAHTVCAALTSIGFLLGLLGILAYSWTAVPLPVGIFASVCMVVCGIASIIALW